MPVELEFSDHSEILTGTTARRRMFYSDKSFLRKNYITLDIT